MLSLLVSLPFIIFVVLLLFKKTRLVTLALYSTFAATVIALIVWKMDPKYITASFGKGALVALDIYMIIFGAIFFLEIVRKNKIIENISYYLESFSRDLRVQVIFLGWFLVNFLEGTAGFGTASTVVVPLLMTLGVSPLNAVIIGMLGNSASGLFGAAGTPIKIGFGSLANSDLAQYAVLINMAGFLVPVFILWFLIKSHNKPIKEFYEALPFALWSGIAFSVSSVLVLPLGVEFPSILGSVIGLVLVLITTKLGIFIPKLEADLIESTKKPTLSLGKTILPYVLFILLLIVGKILLISSGYKVDMLIPHTIAFFNPGIVFVITGIIVAVFYKLSIRDAAIAAKLSFTKSFEPFAVITLMSAFAQLMLNSQHNFSGMTSMVNVLADNFDNMLLPIWAPVLGAFGSFLTGSVTVSNIMFSNFLFHSATDLNMPANVILALAAAGGAAGNMIAMGDIITSESVVGLINSERKVLKAVIVPCIIYITLIAIIGIIIV